MLFKVDAQAEEEGFRIDVQSSGGVEKSYFVQSGTQQDFSTFYLELSKDFGTRVPAVFGEPLDHPDASMRITREAQPDPKDADWVSVRVEPVRPLEPVTLSAIKAEPALAKMELIRQSRLSVAPVRDEEWAKILQMAGK